MPEKNLKTLIIGSGGREHALVKASLASPLVSKTYAAPGNGGMAAEAECKALDVNDIDATVALAQELEIDLAIVGPEVPLCLGVVDALQKVGIAAYGPTKDGARLEASKAFTKDFLFKYKIPTSSSETFTEVQPALEYIQSQSMPIVVKASGLAAGKGVIIAQNEQEAETAVRDMLENKIFGESGSEVVIEEFLEGEEASIHVIICGENYVLFPPSQDHKRIGENDTGLNTGGMGAYCPAEVVTDEVNQQIIDQIIEPTIQGLKTEGIDYRGTLFIGIMITPNGPKVLEFNVRFGDPETQVLLPQLENDPVSIMYECAMGKLNPQDVRLKDTYSVVVVMAAGGYPGSYGKGFPIEFPDSLPPNAQVIHAGTSLDDENKIVTNGGRVLGITASGKTLEEAVSTAYAICNSVQWEDCYYRRDIAAKQLNREQKCSVG